MDFLAIADETARNMQAHEMGVTANLLKPRRELASALADYIKASGKLAATQPNVSYVRLDRSFRLYHAMPLARQIVCLGGLQTEKE